MRDILESTKVDSLVVPELPVAHVAVVLDDFSNMLGRKVLYMMIGKTVNSGTNETHLLSHVHISPLAFFSVPLLLHLHPLLGLLREDVWWHTRTRGLAEAGRSSHSGGRGRHAWHTRRWRRHSHAWRRRGHSQAKSETFLAEHLPLPDGEEAEEDQEDEMVVDSGTPEEVVEESVTPPPEDLPPHVRSLSSSASSTTSSIPAPIAAGLKKPTQGVLSKLGLPPVGTLTERSTNVIVTRGSRRLQR